MPTIKVPPVLRPQTDGEAEVSVEGATVGESLRALAERYPQTKDQLENSLHDRVCSGQMKLARAQRIFERDWRPYQ